MLKFKKIKINKLLYRYHHRLKRPVWIDNRANLKLNLPSNLRVYTGSTNVKNNNMCDITGIALNKTNKVITLIDTNYLLDPRDPIKDNYLKTISMGLYYLINSKCPLLYTNTFQLYKSDMSQIDILKKTYELYNKKKHIPHPLEVDINAISVSTNPIVLDTHVVYDNNSFVTALEAGETKKIESIKAFFNTCTHL